MQALSIIGKIATVSLITATMAITTGCANKRSSTSEVVVAPMGVPGSAIYGNAAGGALVTNSTAVQAAAENIRGVVYFAFDSSAIDGTAQGVLDQQAAFLAANPSAQVLIAGHTDERGSREYNHALGERRAQAVKSYLATKGIPDASIETVSYGEEAPAIQGTTEEAYAANRRAELSY